MIKLAHLNVDKKMQLFEFIDIFVIIWKYF